MTGRYDPNRHHRHSTRLSGWDYRTQALYFVTICTHNRDNLFESPAYSDVANTAWERIPGYPGGRGVILDEWVIMPNHLHGILLMPGPAADMDDDTEAVIPGLPFDMRYGGMPVEQSASPPVSDGNRRPPAPPHGSLGATIGSYKSRVTRRINNLRRSPGDRVWQRGYYDHIVRDHHELQRIQVYIRENPARWAEDHDNPDALIERMVYRPGS